MTLALMTVLALADALPTVDVAWHGDDATLTVGAPAGWHVAADAPAGVDLRWEARELQLAIPGKDASRGVPLFAVRGREIRGAMRVPVCEDGSTACRIVDLSVTGSVPLARKGVLALHVEPGPYPLPAGAGPTDHLAARWGGGDSAKIAEQAVAQAKRDDRLVMYDFAAVWCPPCALLAAEVLESDTPPEVLDQFVVARVDVDDASSFDLKSRYQVGGYPTIIVATTDGTEVARMVGYPGRDAFEAWMWEALDGGPDADIAGKSPADVDPERAAAVAWRMSYAGQDGVEPWLEQAKKAPENVEYRLASLYAEPIPGDVTWLAEHAAGRALEWAPRAMELAEADAEVKAVVRTALLDAVGELGPADAADAIAYVAMLSGEDEALALYAAATATLRAALTGDPERDKAYYTWLAVLIERSGHVDDGLAFLEQQTRRWPDDPTYVFALSRMYFRNKQYPAALAWADKAVALSWGDNLLRAAHARAETLQSLGRDDEARAFAQEILASQPAPADGLKIRTPKYRKRLQELVDGTEAE